VAPVTDEPRPYACPEDSVTVDLDPLSQQGAVNGRTKPPGAPAVGPLDDGRKLLKAGSGRRSMGARGRGTTGRMAAKAKNITASTTAKSGRKLSARQQAYIYRQELVHGLDARDWGVL
jgi:hypothetical protein